MTPAKIREILAMAAFLGDHVVDHAHELAPVKKVGVDAGELQRVARMLNSTACLLMGELALHGHFNENG